MASFFILTLVPEFAKSGAYFSLSGILLESDAPDALSNSELGSLFLVSEDTSLPQEFFAQGRSSASNVSTPSNH
ncbi:Uncharacterized protein TCM_025672 [Theobroma cacao]|uniref:Uncharacterized protein n=1 Tax=Theobroma cacao TaxID=3641 RepID=A0A061EZS9_THECC|nr:Uncharacterized protein TCM_025672 [Theobroma cacao]